VWVVKGGGGGERSFGSFRKDGNPTAGGEEFYEKCEEHMIRCTVLRKTEGRGVRMPEEGGLTPTFLGDEKEWAKSFPVGRGIWEWPSKPGLTNE